jgi:hypothetical protein
MDIQPISYRGQRVAACTRTRMFFSDELEAGAAQDPPMQFAVAMCLYAGEILNDLHEGPYCDDDARAYARAMLIPSELLEPPRPLPVANAAETAQALGVPLPELFVELGRSQRARWMPAAPGTLRWPHPIRGTTTTILGRGPLRAPAGRRDPPGGGDADRLDLDAPAPSAAGLYTSGPPDRHARA